MSLSHRSSNKTFNCWRLRQQQPDVHHRPVFQFCSKPFRSQLSWFTSRSHQFYRQRHVASGQRGRRGEAKRRVHNSLALNETGRCERTHGWYWSHPFPPQPCCEVTTPGSSLINASSAQVGSSCTIRFFRDSQCRKVRSEWCAVAQQKDLAASVRISGASCSTLKASIWIVLLVKWNYTVLLLIQTSQFLIHTSKSSRLSLSKC